ncbi:MAG: 1-deoxy-D-xylulose-5-phosphate reductoisomerase [Bacteroidales bacterium]|nr:1-deoxy-D-xylulose-5-phosphate reductoisomerase [Bacteroidales bacterium]
MENKRRIAILGATGSIGQQALDVVARNREMFEVELLTANENVEQLAKDAIAFDANAAVICNPQKYGKLASALEGTDVKAFAGIDSVVQLVAGDNIDIVLTAMVGFSGMLPTTAAVKAGKTIALANKETLVAGGAFIIDLVKKYDARILPVDSEHSAIFQCLMGAAGNSIRKIHLTGSGGPFRTWAREDIAKATAAQALKHPNWTMGAKITIDSSTLMNKGFEMIEASWLFCMEPKDIEVVIHPESVIHSMIEYDDGAVLAQMASPDMRQPIQFALCFPMRPDLNSKKLNFSQLGKMTFEAPDLEKFPCLALAYEAARRGGNIACAMNAANEVAVAAFLAGQIGFYDIPALIEKAMDTVPFVKTPVLEDLLATHEQIMAQTKERIK